MRTSQSGFLVPALLAFAFMGVDLYAADNAYPEQSDGNAQTEDGQPMLGVNMSPVPVPVQREQNIRHDEGVYVRRVYDGTTAAQMGVQQGDVILDINGHDISSMSAVRESIFSHHVGDDVQVTVMRNGQRVELGGQLGGWPKKIPLQNINADAEERYRDMQARRLARESEQMQEELERNQKQLERMGDTGNEAEAKDLPEGLNQLESAMMQDYGTMPAEVLPDVKIPALAAFLPAWQFDFELAASSEDEQEGARTAKYPHTGVWYELDPELIRSLAPRIDIDYSISESTESL